MILGIFHQGSGLGNQLSRYITTRVLALDKGLPFGMVNPHLFKGQSLFDLDLGKSVYTDVIYPSGESLKPMEYNVYMEKTNGVKDGVTLRDFDPDLKNVLDDTVIEGEFQSEKYWLHRKDEIREWLKTEPLFLPSNHCVIAFRGGEFKYVPELFLPKSYYDNAMANMLKLNPRMTFEVVTDDVEEALKYFPNIKVTHQIERDWRAIRWAKYLIVSNSSFAIFPAWLNSTATVIAPKYWGRFNTSNDYWCLDQNKYDGWFYQDREGNLEMYVGNK